VEKLGKVLNVFSVSPSPDFRDWSKSIGGGGGGGAGDLEKGGEKNKRPPPLLFPQ